MCNNLTITFNRFMFTGNCYVPPDVRVKKYASCPKNAFQFGPILITNTDYFPQQH
jgi:hypothetical protein